MLSLKYTIFAVKFDGMSNFIYLFLVILCFVACAFALLAIRIILKKNGRFPNIHIGSNKEMRKRGIGCVQSQDRQDRNKDSIKIKEFQ